MATSLPSFPPFSVHDSAPHIRWRKWTARLDNLIVGMGIKDKKRQRALLLHFAGDDVNDIFETLYDTGDDYESAKQSLTDYFSPKKNPEYEIYTFRQAKQNNGESIDGFHTRLRQLSITCEFADNNKEIKSQIIQGCNSTRLRRRALEKDLDLTKLLSMARAFETANNQANEIERNAHQPTTESVNKTNSRNYNVQHQKPHQTYKRKAYKHKESDRTRICRYCGGEFPHKTTCPAQGKICNYCKKPNHFESACRIKRRSQGRRYVKTVEDDQSSSDDEYTFGIKTEETVNHVRSKQPKCKIKINDLSLNILVDTGSSKNVIDKQTFDKLKWKIKLKPSNTKVFAYGSKTHLPMIGRFDATIESADKIITAPVFVASGSSGNLLGYETWVDLKLIPSIASIAEKNHEELSQKYASVFEGLGKLKDTKIKLHIDENVTPVAQPHRRIPFHVRKQVEKELERLEKLDIIEKVDGPTPWVSPIVVAPKPKRPGEIRICVDMRQPNTTIQRERHITPTIDDLIVDLNGSTVFSKLDLNAGYHQLELDEKSRYITTFSSHVGLRRYKRLNFGVSSAAEIFQNTLRTSLEGLDGVRNVSDDVIVFGRTQEEHDKRLEDTLKRLQKRNLTLNKGKCEFNKSQLEFYGYIFNTNGISADPKKIEAINNAETPKNVSEVRSFLGMTNYVGRFIPDHSTVTQPLRMLTKNDVQWQWDENQQKAFDKLKQELTSKTVMSYFDPQKETTPIVDASPVGLGAILLQDDRVIAYASKALTDVETRYSQTEREALAIVWSCEHFHLYVYGHTFTLISDHQPLECIFNNPKSKPPARIERWRLRLQPYNFTVKYKPGKTNAADNMSRHPSAPYASNKHAKIAEDYVTYISDNAVPKAMTLDEICSATKDDNEIQSVFKNINSGRWNKSYENKTLQTFSRLRHTLTIVPLSNGEVLLYDKKIVIPKQLQAKVIQLAHEGHQGIVKTKQLLREKVWFPGIDKQVEQFCKTCIPCLASIENKRQEPLKMTKLPDSPWKEVSMDFCGPFPSGVYLMVVIDDYSRCSS